MSDQFLENERQLNIHEGPLIDIDYKKDLHMKGHRLNANWAELDAVIEIKKWSSDEESDD